MLFIIAANRTHFDHICHMYRIEHDQVRHIHSAVQLRGLTPDSIIIFGDEWWKGKTLQETEEIEAVVKLHNERRK